MDRRAKILRAGFQDRRRLDVHEYGHRRVKLRFQHRLASPSGAHPVELCEAAGKKGALEEREG
jgi:hypothetical protein